MAQVKIYGHTAHLAAHRQAISDAIHAASMQVLGLPEGKRFHRFFPLTAEDFVHPADRSTAYLILEIHLFQGRQPATLRQYIRQLQINLGEGVDLPLNDLEVTLIETPAAHWGIRGQIGDELRLNYEVTK
ncbi:tautomerase family protein [Deinococcus alpinitundrae]|uniref:tautomerase family protein n=1 Tax=Deinococcus alpinitundrae TaxID=468913 RepID=UPI00137ACB3D|nr:tautomerase family protein [Deinococcus alpinitundrae]